MPTSGSYIFSDPADYEASLHEMLELLVVPPHDFHARLTQVELPNLRLLRAQETAPRAALVSLPRELASVTFLTQQDPPLICDGADLAFGDLMFHSCGERFYQRTTAACSWGYISLTPASLMTFSRVLTGQDLSPPSVSRMLRPLPADRTRLLRLHAQAARIAETKLNHIGHPEVARALEQEVVWALATCLTSGDSPADPAVRRRYAKILARFDEVLAAHPCRLLQIAEVSSAVGVSERALRECCSKAFGMAPGRYMRLRRLRLARAALLRANPARASITEVGQRHGFATPHRFLKEYLDAYGAIPSMPPRRPADR